MKRDIYISGAELCDAKMSGIPRYMHEVIMNLDNLLDEEHDSPNIYICYPKGKNILLGKLNNIRLIELDKPENRPWNTGVFRDYVRNNNGIFVGMSNNKTVLKDSIITVHDVRRLECREFDGFKARLNYYFQMQFVKKYASHIMTLTEYQKNSIQKCLGISPERIGISYCGYEHILEVGEDEGIFSRFPQIKKDEYYYAVGSVASHKNYKWILKEAENNPDKQFVVAGLSIKEKWGIDDSDFAADNIIYTGFVTDEENKSLIKCCRAFLHPSKYEGFGIPPLEALALGKPIFVSEATCLPEIYNQVAVMFDPDDYNVDLDRIFVPDGEAVKSLLDTYSWKKVSGVWLLLFKKVCNE